MNVWDGDVRLDTIQAAELARRTGLVVQRCDPFGEGWDNVAFLVNGRWVFRFPRREIAVPWIAREIVVLPQLAQHLGLAIPRPRWIGQPTELFERPYFGYDLLTGTTLCRSGLAAAARRAIAPTVASFLRSLHDIADDAIVAPPDDFDRVGADRRIAIIDDRITGLRGEGVDVPDRLHELAHELHERHTPATGHAWVHGDFYARHVLVSAAPSPWVTAVIDWGDVHFGDVALDLSIAWSAFDSDGRRAFFDTYGAVDTATADRARFKAILYAVTFIAYGRDIDDPFLIREGEAAIAHLLADIG